MVRRRYSRIWRSIQTNLLMNLTSEMKGTAGQSQQTAYRVTKLTELRTGQLFDAIFSWHIGWQHSRQLAAVKTQDCALGCFSIFRIFHRSAKTKDSGDLTRSDKAQGLQQKKVIVRRRSWQWATNQHFVEGIRFVKSSYTYSFSGHTPHEFWQSSKKRHFEAFKSSSQETKF